MAEVILKDVCKVFQGGVKAVNMVNADIRDREFIVLVGPSGCGKSTTLRMVAGLEEISSGTISIDGRVINDIPARDRDIAMVFQNYALYPHMTVFDNMAFSLKLRRFPKKEIRERVARAADMLGLSEYLERKPAALSGGQRQRVALGRAIVRQPKVFLFDEPLSNLDAKMRVQMRAEIIRFHNQMKATMIYVTHDQVEAMTMGDRIVVMKDGLVQQTAGPLELYRRPANLFVAGFIGTPPMNFFRGRLEARGGDIFFACASGTLKTAAGHSSLLAGYAGKEVVMGIRSENITTSGPESSIRQGVEQITAGVDVVEPMGAEIFLELIWGTDTLAVKVDADNCVQTGEKLRLDIDMQKAHFFDAATEVAIA